MNLKEIKNQPDKAIIATPVTGVISDVKPAKSGEGQYGPWTIQGAKLTQGSEFVFVNFKNMEDMTQFNGQSVTITSGQTQHGLKGVAVKKNGQYTNLDITAMAQIQIGVQPQQPAPTTPAPQTQQAPRQSSQPMGGQMVGAAVNKATDAMVAVGVNPLDDEFKNGVYKIASSLIRIMQRLEKGQLAPLGGGGQAPAATPKPPVNAQPNMVPASSLPQPPSAQEVTQEDVPMDYDDDCPPF